MSLTEGWSQSQRVTDIDWSRWEPTMRATLLFVITGGKVLMIHKKRGLGAGKINGPGGRMEPGETPVQCAVREVEEEVCIRVLDPRPVGRLRFQFRDGLRLQGMIFTGSQYEGSPCETEEAIPCWFPVDRIPYNRMWQDDELWMPSMLAGRTFDGRFIFDGDVMIDHLVQIAET